MKRSTFRGTLVLFLMGLGGSVSIPAQPVEVRQDFILGNGDRDATPHTLDLDAAGNIYVGVGNEIWVYDSGGTRRMVWQFLSPTAVRVGPEGNIYVSRGYEPTSRIRVLDAKTGQQLREFGTGNWLHGSTVGLDVPSDAIIDPDGNVWSPDTNNLDEPEALPGPNLVWGSPGPPDPNGGRLMYFDLKADPMGHKPTYFGTFSNVPPEKGGPADGLHEPARLAFDSVHKKIFLLDDWGVTRWNWPDGKFEGRILRLNFLRGHNLLATTPAGTLYLTKDNVLSEYDWEGKLLKNHPEIDLNWAQDMRVSPDGAIYLCYSSERISFKKYSAPSADQPAQLLLCRGLDVIKLSLRTEDQHVTAGQKIGITAKIDDRRNLYNLPMPELDELKPSLWFKPYRHGASWQELPIEMNGDKQFVTIPVDASGAAQLRLSGSAVAPALLDKAEAFIDLPLGVRPANGKDGRLTIVTDRSQTQFVCGQWMRVNLVGRSKKAVANETVQVQLTDASAKAVAHQQINWSVIEQSTATVSLDVRIGDNLPPGNYALTAVSPALGQASFPLSISVPRENGKFKMFTALELGSNKPPEETLAYVAIASQDGISHDITRYLFSYPQFGATANDLEINRQMRAALVGDPTLPAPESAELSTRMRVGLNAMAADGMHLWPEMMGWETDTVNRTDAQMIQDKQNLSFWTQWGLSSPAQDGFLWNETNWWGVDHSRLQPQWSQATGKSLDTLKGLSWDRLTEYTPLLSGASLDAALSYQEFMAKTLYSANYQRWKEYVHAMRPDSIGAGTPAFAYMNWPVWSSKWLDAVMDYQQIEQTPEAFAGLEDAAFFRHEGKPFWLGREIYCDTGTGEYLTRQLLPGLLYGAEGFWANAPYSNLMDLPMFEDQLIEGDRHGLMHQAVADLRAVLEPVGSRLRNTRRRAELGIYFPRAAWVQGENHAFDGDNYYKRVDAALIASFHAHLPAAIVFDEELDSAPASGVKYLLLPGLQSDIPSEAMSSLQRFKQRGGIILLGQGCSAAYDNLGPALNINFSIFAKYGWSDWYQGDDRLAKRLDVIALAAQMTTAMAPYLQPPVQIDDPDIWYSLLDGKDRQSRPLTYLVAINQNQPEGLTPGQLWKMTSSYTTMIPVLRTAVLSPKLRPAFHFAYDLLGGKPLEIKDGHVELDFHHFPGRIIALSTVPLAASDLQEAVGSPLRSSAAPDTTMKATPEVDLFQADQIRTALHSKQTIYVSADSSSTVKSDSFFSALKAGGLSVQTSSDPVHEPGAHVALCSAGDALGQDAKDMLPVRLSEDVPGLHRAIAMYVHAFLPGATDAIVVAASDDTGLSKAGAKLAELAHSNSEAPPVLDSRLLAPAFRPAIPATLKEDTIVNNWGARLGSIRAAGPTVAVGAAEWGNNLFLLDSASGKLLSASKAGRFYVDKLWMSADGQAIGAEAIYPEDVNGYLELFDRAGNSRARYARDGLDNHANFNFYSHTMRLDIYSFALSPDGQTVYSSSNLGLTAMGTDGHVIWRHDYTDLYTGLDVLRSKWAARIDLTPNGKFLAVGLTHEEHRNETDPPDTYHGISKVSLVDAQTGNAAWEISLEPVDRPFLTQVCISPDGRTIAAVDSYYGVMLFREGKLIKQRKGSYRRIVWSDDSKTLFALISHDSGGDTENRYGIIALNDEGIPTAQYEQYEPIVGLSPAPHGRVAIIDSARQVRLISTDGKLQWTAKLDACGALFAGSDAVYACDWHGNIYKLDMDSGARLWMTNVTPQTWRPDMESLPSAPYTGPTFGVHPRRPDEKPLTGTDITGSATVTAGGSSGWGGTGAIQIDPKILVDAQLNQLKEPWLNLHENYKAAERSRFSWIQLSWPNPVNFSGLSIHEDERHPESWPYEACLQVWENGAWKDVAVSLQTPGPWHNLALAAPMQVQKIRYCVTSILANNLWTDEIRAIAAP